MELGPLTTGRDGPATRRGLCGRSADTPLLPPRGRGRLPRQDGAPARRLTPRAETALVLIAAGLSHAGIAHRIRVVGPAGQDKVVNGS
ncbi:hypothetical protein OG605_09950 [Streptomyces xanthophaeus]|nr:hypothetical protein OG605_09950 [Streptomyces xanthophaeus]